MKCPKCGKEIADDSVYCAYCRYKIQKKKNSFFHWLIVIIVGGLCVIGAKAFFYYNHFSNGSTAEEVNAANEESQSTMDVNEYNEEKEVEQKAEEQVAKAKAVAVKSEKEAKEVKRQDDDESSKIKAEAEKAFAYAAIVKEEAERAKAKSDLTIPEMEDFIIHANVALAKLRRIIRNPCTPKDDRLKAYYRLDSLEYERDDMFFRLEAARKGIVCILPTDTFGINMDVTQMKAFIKNADEKINKLSKVIDASEISSEERVKVYQEYKQLKRFRNTIQMRLDEEER